MKVLTTALRSQGATLTCAELTRKPKISLAQRLQSVEHQFCKQFVDGMINQTDSQQGAEMNNRDRAACLLEKHVLLVEDDPIIQIVHRKYLEILGFTVDVASNGKQALAQYQPGKYYVIILDGGLPDTTGFELAKIIRSQEHDQHQYLIMLSAFDYDDVKEKCQEASIDAFAIKPVPMEQLHELVKQWLQNDLKK
jgi:CheY-like chemotaxis protein